LANAVKALRDEELGRLLTVILAEQKRRGKKRPGSDKISRQRQAKVVPVQLAQGKLNAVRAAFKAGVTPSRIARQFGISLADVRKALASVSGKQ
jgi:DNA invertase Pin-like site-specific DNA recombinase